MTRLDRDPQVAQLAKELGLQGRGSWVAQIQAFARVQVERLIQEAGVAINTADDLLRVLADRLSVKVEFVRLDEDLGRIQREHGMSEAEYRVFCSDLNNPNVDGLLIVNPAAPRAGSREFLAVVDARGEQAHRAYFTAWHEVAHLIVTPPQRAFRGMYRTISSARRKDPEESVVDVVAGDLAFYEPLLRPVVERVLGDRIHLTFEMVDEVRMEIVPDASFYATAIAVVRIVRLPVLLVQVKPGLNAKEARRLGSGQHELSLGSAVPPVREELRANDAIASPSARDQGVRIFPNMRVPAQSILTEVFSASEDQSGCRREDQAWWEPSSTGPLPSLAIRVEAVRRGSYVYGLIAPEV